MNTKWSRRAMDIAFRSEGDVAQAIKEAKEDKDPWLDEFKQWMRLSYMRDITALYKWSENMASARATHSGGCYGAINGPMLHGMDGTFRWRRRSKIL
ncbi:MAG: hypothetical protein R2813_03360 [Flavobacteriales bacterium]